MTMWIKKFTKEERIIWRLLDLKKELEIGFAKVNVKLEKIDAITDWIENYKQQKTR